MHLNNPLWQFCLALYADSRVKQHCLDAQAEGLRVNYLLLATWLAVTGKRWPTEVDWSQLDVWHTQVIAPIRHARMHLKNYARRSVHLVLPQLEPDVNDLYIRAKEIELHAEQLELAQLWHISQGAQLFQEARPLTECLTENLQAYVRIEALQDPSQASLVVQQWPEIVMQRMMQPDFTEKIENNLNFVV